MAKVDGIINLQGTLGDLTFYKQKGKTYVRRKSSIDGKRILNDPKFIRTKEHALEFGKVAKVGKLIRIALSESFHQVGAKLISSKLHGVLCAIKNLDTSSERGKRNVAAGLESPKGRDMLMHFNLNPVVTIDQILSLKPKVDVYHGVVSIKEFSPLSLPMIPAGATHVLFHTEWALIDLASGEFSHISTNAEPIPINDQTYDLELHPAYMLQGSGRDIIVLTIQFATYQNGHYVFRYDSSCQTGMVLAVN